MMARIDGLYGGLRTVDYSGVLWDHSADIDVPKPVDDLKIFELFSDELFRPRGFVYGPLRGPFSLGHDPRFRRIVFIRDPRDTLVSMYYSMGWSHPLPPDPERAELFLALRERARRLGIDGFAIDQAYSWLAPLLAQYRQMATGANEWLAVFRYEDLITRPQATVTAMLDMISGGLAGGPTTESILDGERFVRSANVDNHHQRNGAAGQYLQELLPSTIARLDRIFGEDLAFFWGSDFAASRRAA